MTGSMMQTKYTPCSCAMCASASFAAAQSLENELRVDAALWAVSAFFVALCFVQAALISVVLVVNSIIGLRIAARICRIHRVGSFNFRVPHQGRISAG